MEHGNSKINILLVDDNPGNLLSLSTILQAPDRNLVHASSGEEALRYLLDNEAAVILLDVHMPTIDGLETAALIRGRERTHDVPIIFLTAYDSAGSSHISEGYSLGAVDYIIKPIDPEALKSKVAVFTELHRKTEQVKQQAELLREKNIELENANLQRLSRLIEVGQQLSSERDPERLLEKFCHEARDIVGAHYAAVVALDKSSQQHFCASGFAREAAIDLGVPEISQRFLNGRYKSNKPMRLSAMGSRLKTLRFLPPHIPITSFLGAPLLRQGQVQGWLYLANKLDAKEFTEADERLAATLAAQAVVAWENALLYAESQRHAADLEQEIAERKQAEKERAELLVREQMARAEAEEANRLKDQFLANVSHELRAPLNAMLGWVMLIRNGRLDDESRGRALETIERNARAQNKLIDDLLDVSRAIIGKLHLELKPTSLASVIEAAIESVRPAAEAKGVHIWTELDPAHYLLQLDSNRLEQVIWNLLTNSVKFTATSGSVEIRLKYVGQQAEISVSDTGIGIASEFLPFVFDRFRQADGSTTRKHSGLGLGLTIVRHLVELHSGSVEAESPGEGQGATFRIRLPLTAPDPTASELAIQKTALPDLTPVLSGLRVLVVDDQAEVLELLTTILHLQEAEVRNADNVDEALRIMAVWQPDILISDIAMPDCDGYEFIRRVRNAGSKLPAISLTAHARAEDRVRALAAGFQMHLSKPVEPYELIVSVASLTGTLVHVPEMHEMKKKSQPGKVALGSSLMARKSSTK
jgi:signal transduction histidine kinase/DNA-binding response OmpR family regulator